MKIRIFGTEKCTVCTAIKTYCSQHQISIEYFDADADENQDICDQYNVDELPHIQVFSGENIEHTFIGYDGFTQLTNGIAIGKIV